MIAVVIETFNLADDAPGEAAATLTALVDALAPQLVAHAAELVITHTPHIPERPLAYPARWLGVARDATYYEHKNLGFDATAPAAEIVAFLDGDCVPSPNWLASIVAPIARGTAEVVAGVTTYPGPLAAVANQLDFPVFPAAAPHTVRNFFANNVAFARATFAAHHYPTIAPMFHGQCQVLALRLGEAGIAIELARDARVVHASPKDARTWLAVRLLKGADCASLVPFVVGSYAPVASPVVARLGALPALALLGARAVTGALAALRHGPRVRNLALVASCTIVDAIGAAAASVVYRNLAPQPVRTVVRTAS